MRVSYGASAQRFFRKNRLGTLAATVLGLVLLAALAGPALWPFSPNEINLDEALLPPGGAHPFGTDNQGRDVLARTLAGARISLGIGVTATFISLMLGTILGLIAGFFGKSIDSAVSRLVDITLAFPSLLLAIAVSVVIPPGLASVFIALSFVGWPTFARLSRSAVLSIKQAEYFRAAEAAGCPAGRLIVRHVLPNCAPVLIVAASLRLGGFMLGEASLSFLGLGVQPPTASWGSMVSHGRDFLHAAPWISLFPGMAIALCIVSMNILGDSLRDHLDPRMRV